MQSQEKEMSPDEQLLNDALCMHHEMACGIVFESLTTGQERKDEELAFAHVYSCMDIRSECGEFWQKMMDEYPDQKSQRKLLKHQHLTKIMEKARDRMFPTLNPFWGQRN